MTDECFKTLKRLKEDAFKDVMGKMNSFMTVSMVSATSIYVFYIIVSIIQNQDNIYSILLPMKWDRAANVKEEIRFVTNTNNTFKIGWFKRPKWFKSSFDFKRCKFTNCVYDDADNKNDLHVVIFNNRYLDKVVPTKTPGQIWIMTTEESPSNDNPLPIQWRNVFDWSATYRKDSEITRERSLKHRLNPLKKNYSEIFQKKTKMVAWIAGNCNTPSKRHLYVKELQKYIDVDTYGQCGENKVFCANKGKSECPITLSKSYKFYLGFENSICKDYITEKVFFSYLDDNDMIYVLRSAQNLNDLVPKDTFINTAEFKSPRDLAAYLHKLSSNETQYISYLKEKNKYFVLENREENTYCPMCELLNTYKKRKLSWTGRHFDHFYRNGACVPPTDF